jgi:LysM repeat protein
MKIVSARKVLTTLIILAIFCNSLFSQVVVERSKDKVIISGTAYYIHQVKKGETVYSISKAYGITVDELTRENPPAVYGIKDGQALRIPVNAVPENAPSQPVTVQKQHDETRFIYHNLKPGETVYFLSKTYGVSEDEIVQSNPGLDISKLSVGSEIAVPRRQFMSDRQKFDDQEKRYIFHKVLMGETLSSIAEKYGLTVRELRRENRDLRFPQVGDFVRIPGAKATVVQQIEQVKTDTVAPVVAEPVVIMERPEGYTPVRELRGSLDVAVLLPFYLKENASRIEIDSSKMKNGRKIFKEIKKSEDWIYPGSFDFVEMYQGILLAADTLRSLGLDINIYAFDIDSDRIGVTKLINSGKLAGMALIIGPVYSYNLTAVAAYAKQFDIPVVSPVPLKNNSALTNNPTLFMANSSLEVAQRALAKKISEYYNSNLVFIHADTTNTDQEVKKFKDLIFTELNPKIPFEEIKFKEFPFYSRSMFDNDSINRLSHALSDQSANTVIIASEEAPVISETIMDVHSLSRKFDIKVFGYPAMREIDNLEPEYLFDLDMMIYTPYWIDYSMNDVKQFNSNFFKKFLTQPLEKSYAWEGYDMAYYFLSGIAMHGKDFITNPGIHRPDLLQTDYDFVRKDPESGFENQKLYLVKYTKDFDVKLLEENNLNPQK